MHTDHHESSKSFAIHNFPFPISDSPLKRQLAMSQEVRVSKEQVGQLFIASDLLNAMIRRIKGIL